MAWAPLGCASILGIEDLPDIAGDAGASGGDGGIASDGAMGIDAGPCGAAVELALAIDGQATPAVPGTPVELDVLIGDEVELSAAGSCAAVGTLEYQWQITPDEGTADPGLDSEVLTFYPTTVGTYTVDVTLGNGMGDEVAVQVWVMAHGWQAIDVAAGNDNVTDIRDLDVSEDDLWIATNAGPFGLPLTGAQDAFVDINSMLTSNFVSGDLSTVYYQGDNRVWFGSGADRSVVWRVDLGQPPVSLTGAFSAANALNTSARVRDLGPAGTSGVVVATDQGLTEATDSLNFTGDVEPGGDQVHVIASGDGRRWGGARLLYDLDDVLAPAIDPFSGGGLDRKIRALAVDEANGELWVGSDDRGIARLDNDTGEVLGTYTYYMVDGLPSDKIRHLRVETSGLHAGDVWAATDAGVARYIRARDAWVAMGADHGLNGFVDIKAIAIDEAGGRRAIYAGTTNGVVYIRTP